VGEKYDWIEEVMIRFRYPQAKESGERGDTAIYREDYGLFPVTGVPANNRVQKKGAIKTDAIPKTPISQEVYASRCYIIGEDRRIALVVKWASHEEDYGAGIPGLWTQ